MALRNDHPMPPLLALSRTECARPHLSPEGCRFQVAWAINPHMKPGAAKPEHAARQHRVFTETLRACGAELLPVDFVHGAFDSVFAKDSAVLATDGRRRAALLANFANSERRQEQRSRTAALEAHGFTVQGPTAVSLEGGDVVQVPGGPVLLGHGFRSSRAARGLLEGFFGRAVVPIELVDPWLYHLDTALTALNDGTLLCCAEAFSPASLRMLLRHPDIREVIFIPREEALQFGLNIVQLGKNVITGAAGARVTESLLTRRGLRVVKVDLSEFQLAGGSAACLVSSVYSERRVATSEMTEIRST